MGELNAESKLDSDWRRWRELRVGDGSRENALGCIVADHLSEASINSSSSFLEAIVDLSLSRSPAPFLEGQRCCACS